MGMLRAARQEDLPAMMDIFLQAKAYMATQGIDQWQGDYPGEQDFREDISLGDAWVWEEDGQVVGIAALVFGEDPFYRTINAQAASGGSGWLTQGTPYATLHRFALRADRRGGGTATAMLRAMEDVCRARAAASLRTDTHRGNRPMRGFLQKNGYTLCGEVIYDVITEGDPIRIAFEKRLRP